MAAHVQLRVGGAPQFGMQRRVQLCKGYIPLACAASAVPRAEARVAVAVDDELCPGNGGWGAAGTPEAVGGGPRGPRGHERVGAQDKTFTYQLTPTPAQERALATALSYWGVLGNGACSRCRAT